MYAYDGLQNCETATFGVRKYLCNPINLIRLEYRFY